MTSKFFMYTSDISNPRVFEIPDYSSLQLSKAAILTPFFQASR